MISVLVYSSLKPFTPLYPLLQALHTMCTFLPLQESKDEDMEEAVVRVVNNLPLKLVIVGFYLLLTLFYREISMHRAAMVCLQQVHHAKYVGIATISRLIATTAALNLDKSTP